MTTHSKPIKVVHLTSAHPALDPRIFQRECRSLAEMGYEVVLIAPTDRDTSRDGVAIHGIRPSRHRLERMLLSPTRIMRKALQEHADLYHFHDPELIPICLLLRLLRKRVVYDVHEDLPRTFDYKTYLPQACRRPLRWLTERLENFASRSFSAIITATPDIAARFCQLNPRVTVVANFPSLLAFQPSSHPWEMREPAVAYVGALSRARGIGNLITALEYLPTESPIKLILAGRFFPESLRDELAQLPGWKRVQYLGQLSPADIPDLLSRVRAGIVALLPQENYLVSMPIKMFEYMAAGLPVIASDFPLWREIVTSAQCGLLVDPADPEEIARAMNTLVFSPEMAASMGKHGRMSVEAKYDWSVESEHLREIYRVLLPQSSHHTSFAECNSGTSAIWR